MKFLQLNINSLNTSVDELWLHHLNNSCNGIFLQETNHKEGNYIENFKSWKMKMHTIFDQKTLGYGVGTLLPYNMQNVFRNDLIRNDLEMVWIKIHIEGKKVVIGNMYVPPKNVEQLYILDEVSEKLRSKDLMIIEDFNARNSVWDKHCKSSSKLRVVLEDVILRHDLYVATNTDHTYHHSLSYEKSGKNKIYLTLTRGIKNISIKTLNIEETNIKARHKTTMIHVGENNIKNP